MQKGPEHSKYPGYFQVSGMPWIYINEETGTSLQDVSRDGNLVVPKDLGACFDQLDMAEPNTYEEAKAFTTGSRFRVASSLVREMAAVQNAWPVMKYTYPEFEESQHKFGWVLEPR